MLDTLVGYLSDRVRRGTVNTIRTVSRYVVATGTMLRRKARMGCVAYSLCACAKEPTSCLLTQLS